MYEHSSGGFFFNTEDLHLLKSLGCTRLNFVQDDGRAESHDRVVWEFSLEQVVFIRDRVVLQFFKEQGMHSKQNVLMWLTHTHTHTHQVTRWSYCTRLSSHFRASAVITRLYFSVPSFPLSSTLPVIKLIAAQTHQGSLSVKAFTAERSQCEEFPWVASGGGMEPAMQGACWWRKGGGGGGGSATVILLWQIHFQSPNINSTGNGLGWHARPSE